MDLTVRFAIAGAAIVLMGATPRPQYDWRDSVLSKKL
jgi:hypothetical protein